MALAIYDPIAKDAELAEILLRGLKDPSKLRLGVTECLLVAQSGNSPKDLGSGEKAH
jgi:hypothetical protein